MSIENRQEIETRLLETLLSALDAREAARLTGSTMLVYLADMLVQRTREELEAEKSGSGQSPTICRNAPATDLGSDPRAA